MPTATESSQCSIQKPLLRTPTGYSPLSPRCPKTTTHLISGSKLWRRFLQDSTFSWWNVNSRVPDAPNLARRSLPNPQRLLLSSPLCSSAPFPTTPFDRHPQFSQTPQIHRSRCLHSLQGSRTATPDRHSLQPNPLSPHSCHALMLTQRNTPKPTNEQTQSFTPDTHTHHQKPQRIP